MTSHDLPTLNRVLAMHSSGEIHLSAAAHYELVRQMAERVAEDFDRFGGAALEKSLRSLRSTTTALLWSATGEERRAESACAAWESRARRLARFGLKPRGAAPYRAPLSAGAVELYALATEAMVAS